MQSTPNMSFFVNTYSREKKKFAYFAVDDNRIKKNTTWAELT